MWSGPYKLYLIRSQWQDARNVWTRTEGGGMLVLKKFCKGMRVIILVCQLSLQSNARSIVTVRIPVPLGTEKASSVDHAAVWPRDRDLDPAVDPTMYMWNGFLEFSAMIWLKVASTTRSSFPSMPSNVSTIGGPCFRCSWHWLTCLSFY